MPELQGHTSIVDLQGGERHSHVILSLHLHDS